MDNLQRRILESTVKIIPSSLISVITSYLENKRSAKLLGLMKAVGSCFHLRSFFSTPSTGGIIFFTLKLVRKKLMIEIFYYSRHSSVYIEELNL